MGPTILFVVCLAFASSQAQDCVPETQPIGSFGQGVPRIDGTTIQSGKYSMIDIDGAAQMPEGIITGIEYRVFKLESVTFQVWRPVDITTGRMKLITSLQLNPTEVEEVIEVKGLNIHVQMKDRWGFSYGGTGDVPVKYTVTRNVPNDEPYYALECSGCADGAADNAEVQFFTKAQKQFRMRAMMSQIVATCPPPTLPPIVECTPTPKAMNKGTTLRNALFNNYNPTSFPGNFNDEPVTINLNYRPREILKFDKEHMKLTLLIYGTQIWKDPQLTWCPEDNGGLTNIRVKPSDIWTADLVSYDMQKQIGPQFEVNGVLYNTGDIHYVPVYVWDFPCKLADETEEHMDFKCSTTVGSWTFSNNAVSPEVESSLEVYLKHPRYELLSSEFTREDVVYPCCPDEKYPTLTMTVTLRVPKDREMPDKEMPRKEMPGTKMPDKEMPGTTMPGTEIPDAGSADGEM